MRALHDLDITDKHIAVVTAGIGVATSSIPFKRMPSDRPNRIILRAQLGAMRTVPVDNTGYGGVDNTRTETLRRFDDREVMLRLAKGLPFEGQPPIAVPNQLADLAERIIQTFEALCFGSKQTGP